MPVESVEHPAMRSASLALGVLILGAALAIGQELPPSTDVTPPQPIKIVKAVYTPQGRAARIEGVVVLEAIVLPDGSVGDDVKVTRSLDTKYGLDEQAVKATKQWTFKPATRDGKPVACPVAIEQSFYLNSKK